MAGLAWAAAGGATSFEEYAIKAELLERLTRFTEWPESAFPDEAEAFVVGVLGQDPFDGHLARVAAQRTVEGLPIRVVGVDPRDDITQCHVLFVAASARSRIDGIVERTRGHPILTVADVPGAAERGILVNLLVENDRVRFEVNVDAVEENQLQLSSKVLRLARRVRTRGDP